SHHTAALELGDGVVGGVRLRLGEHPVARAVELPDALGVAAERLDRAVLERVVPRPDPRRRAKVRDPALRRDPGTGQDDHRRRPARPPARPGAPPSPPASAPGPGPSRKSRSWSRRIRLVTLP